MYGINIFLEYILWSKILLIVVNIVKNYLYQGEDYQYNDKS